MCLSLVFCCEGNISGTKVNVLVTLNPQVLMDKVSFVLGVSHQGFRGFLLNSPGSFISLILTLSYISMQGPVLEGKIHFLESS